MKLNSFIVLSLPVFVLAGCASAPTRIEAGGANAVTTMGADVRDFKAVAGDLTQSLLNSPALGQNIGHTPVIKVGKILNDTAQNFDTDQITFKITTDILNSGKAQWISDDATTQAYQNQNLFRSDQKVKALPDYVLYAKILQQQARVGRTRENTFTMQFVLADAKSGNTVWQSEKDFAKQGTRAGVGF